MSGKTILVIDDSATIRRLVDSCLSPAGYRVLLAPTAELGLKLASELHPDLILLDHQLPGTTGYEVCRKLLEAPKLARTPVVVSSTLRKRAYAEYTDLPNVVDMLPKPYTAELLTTTVANGLDTGALVIESQSQGSAVPEVIHDPGEADLAGSFRCFGLRDVLDFLTNGNQRGLLEVEAEQFRVAVFLEGGRIQAVNATGIDAQELAGQLPEMLRSLAPVMSLTMGGRSCAEVDGLVQLLDKRVLDPRLLQKLLRHQAAVLLQRCYTTPLKEFRFLAGRTPPALYARLPLDISALALLIDGALSCAADRLPGGLEHRYFARRAVRGQNLDRAGVSAQHMQLLTQLSEPHSFDQLLSQLGWSRDELARVLFALMLAELVEGKLRTQTRQVLALEADAAGAQQLRALLSDSSGPYTGRVVRDRLALQLVLRRSTPDLVLVALDNDECCHLAGELQRAAAQSAARYVGIVGDAADHRDLDGWSAHRGLPLAAIVARPYSPEQLAATLDSLSVPAPENSLTPCGH